MRHRVLNGESVLVVEERLRAPSREGGGDENASDRERHDPPSEPPNRGAHEIRWLAWIETPEVDRGSITHRRLPAASSASAPARDAAACGKLRDRRRRS